MDRCVVQFICLMLFGVTGAMGSTSTAFLLGVDYSEWLGGLTNQIATDSSGSVYILSDNTSSTVTKLSPDGKTILWQNQLGFGTLVMAVDPDGGVYVIPTTQSGDSSVYVAKLAADGTGLAWKTAAGLIPTSSPVLAVDTQGRAYVAAQYATGAADVVRLNAAGNGIEYASHLAGIPLSIAVDQTGAAFVVGVGSNAEGVAVGFLARLAPDGSSGFYSVQPAVTPEIVALDAKGNVAVLGVEHQSGAGVVQRIDSTGAVTLSTTLSGQGSRFALDALGNAYVTAGATRLFAVRNSLATCGFDFSSDPAGNTELLTVIAADGEILQATYLPGGGTFGSPLIAEGPNSTVFVAAPAGPAFAPSQSGPFPAGASNFFLLARLSPHSGASVYPLACVGNSASLEAGPIALGELITLFGNGLGPQQGVQTQPSQQAAYPTGAAGVEVTFDGTPAPLLWVQDAQINAVAPWSLTAGQNTRICVSYGNTSPNCLTWPVVQAVPGVFTVNGVYAAAVNEDGTINSATNPAAVGSIVSVWATGLGPISPALRDGAVIGLPLPYNLLPVSIMSLYVFPYIGAVVVTPFNFTYVGPAPDMVAGASQINLVVPAGYASHFAPIYLTLPSAQSPGFSLYVEQQ
jgi:uncharacterized protein (TIGR03437 family)